MAKTSTQKSSAFFHQDVYDKATIKVLHELQKSGFCRNVTSIEEYLDMPKRSLLLVTQGQRHVSKKYRSTLLQFFTNNYNVNPLIFQRLSAPVFRDDHPPTLEEQQEPYFSKKGEASNVISMGDFAHLERLKKELADKDAKIKELEKEVKYWRGLAQKSLVMVPNGDAPRKKTGHKTGQKGKK